MPKVIAKRPGSELAVRDVELEPYLDRLALRARRRATELDGGARNAAPRSVPTAFTVLLVQQFAVDEHPAVADARRSRAGSRRVVSGGSGC